MLRFMLKNHLRFISAICLLMALVHIKNSIFTSQNQGLISPIPKILSPNTATLNPLDPESPALLKKDISAPTNNTLSTKNALNPESELQNEGLKNSPNNDSINLIKITSIKRKKTANNTSVSEEKNSFLNTYQKFALLEFNKNVKKQFILDLKDMPKDFLSIGFTVDKGSIQQPKVEVKYSNGSKEVIKLPFTEMFQDDWVKLETNPNLKIESINVTALSPVDKSIFSFFIQEHL